MKEREYRYSSRTQSIVFKVRSGLIASSDDCAMMDDDWNILKGSSEASSSKSKSSFEALMLAAINHTTAGVEGRSQSWEKFRDGKKSAKIMHAIGPLARRGLLRSRHIASFRPCLGSVREQHDSAVVTPLSLSSVQAMVETASATGGAGSSSSERVPKAPVMNVLPAYPRKHTVNGPRKLPRVDAKVRCCCLPLSLTLSGWPRLETTRRCDDLSLNPPPLAF